MKNWFKVKSSFCASGGDLNSFPCAHNHLWDQLHVIYCDHISSYSSSPRNSFQILLSRFIFSLSLLVCFCYFLPIPFFLSSSSSFILFSFSFICLIRNSLVAVFLVLYIFSHFCPFSAMCLGLTGRVCVVDVLVGSGYPSLSTKELIHSLRTKVENILSSYFSSQLFSVESEQSKAE